MLKNIIFALLSLAALGTSPGLMAADTPPDQGEVAPVQPLPASPPDKQAAMPVVNKPLPVNDNHVDYRYCLELKTDREIAACRYKK